MVRQVDGGSDEEQAVTPDLWASRAATTLMLAARISTLLFIGAGLAVVLGVVAAVASYSAYGGTDTNELMSLSAYDRGFAAWQSSSLLSNSLLPAGLLAAAGVALRLQASRFEAEILDG